MGARITVTVANTMLDAGIGTLANSGKLRFYDGLQPAAGGGAITSQQKLAEFTMNVDAFPAASAGVLTANSIDGSPALLSGRATWFRLVKSDGVTVLYDGAIGENESGAEIVIDNPNVVADAGLSIVSFTIALPLQ